MTPEQLAALVAERDALQAEVARLSTPPDDAEVRGWIETLTEMAMVHDADYEDTGYQIDKRLADEAREMSASLTHLSHAHAAERKLADDLADGLVEAMDQVWRDTTWHLKQNETLAAHAARRKE